MEALATALLWLCLALSLVYGVALAVAQMLTIARPDLIEEAALIPIRRLFNKLMTALVFLVIGIFGGYDMALNDAKADLESQAEPPPAPAPLHPGVPMPTDRPSMKIPEPGSTDGNV